jgi:hypothetical protein
MSIDNPFSTIEHLANREIARRIVAAMRDGDPRCCWASGERLIAAALNDAQVLGTVEGARQK